MRPSGIGGQAVFEGVMMKNKDHYAVAVRKPDNEIVVEQNTFVSKSEKYKVLKLPVLRGILAFIESMQIGTKTLTFSTDFFEEEAEQEPSRFENFVNKVFKGKAEQIVTVITICISVLMAVGIFIALPTWISSLLSSVIPSYILRGILEGFIRIAIFIGYVAAISCMKEIKRVFMYHGAEHKTINCIENGDELTVENVRRHSKQHKRCGTSFMFIVMFLSIIFFLFIQVDNLWLKMLLRVLLVPVIAGVSYEFIRLAGRSENCVVNILSKPGLWLQGLTTKEPDDAMIEVAIKSVEAVFDWREYLNLPSEDSGEFEWQDINDGTGDNLVKESIYGESALAKEVMKNDKSHIAKKSKDSSHDDVESIIISKHIDNLYDEDDEVLKALDKYFMYKEESQNE